MKTGRDMGRVRALHQAVDAALAPLAAAHTGRLRCGRGCSSCCVDGIEVSGIEADRIREEFGVLLMTERPHPAGACAFLGSEGECRVWAARPYQCRIAGLPLRWVAPLPNGDGHGEYRDWCPLNESAEHPLEALPAEVCWTLGPVEKVLSDLDAEGAAPRQVPLRTLFTTRS